jgi:Na+-transporting methylmalonyl-CoA/oxaloacetate decarboxylase gamma subunit
MFTASPPPSPPVTVVTLFNGRVVARDWLAPGRHCICLLRSGNAVLFLVLVVLVVVVVMMMVMLARAFVGVEVRDNGRCHADDEDQRHNQDHRIPERVQVT